MEGEGRGEEIEGEAADLEKEDFGPLDLTADLMKGDDLLMNLLQIEAIGKKTF